MKWYLVCLYVALVRKVMSRGKQVDVLTVPASIVQVVRDHTGHKVLARPRPAMERQRQGLLWVGVPKMGSEGLHDDRPHQVLAVQSCTQHFIQGWKCMASIAGT